MYKTIKKHNRKKTYICMFNSILRPINTLSLFQQNKLNFLSAYFGLLLGTLHKVDKSNKLLRCVQ